MLDFQGRSTLTVAEAAEILGISRGSAYAAAQSGDLPTIRFGRRLLVPKKALSRLIDGAQDQDQSQI